MSKDNDIPHLRQIDPLVATALAERAQTLCPGSGSVRLEARAFALSRTPWDATRLANAIAALAGDKSPDATELVRDIDQAAEDCAGLVPTNRLQRSE